MSKYVRKTIAVLAALIFCFSVFPLSALADGQYDTAFLVYDDNVYYEEIAVPETQRIANDDDVKTFTVSSYVPVRNEYEFLGWSTEDGYYNTVNVGETVDVPTGETLTIYAVWGEKTAKAIIYDANLPYRITYEAGYDIHEYCKYESDIYGNGLENNLEPNEWTLVYHLPGDTGYVPVLQGQNGKYISLSDWDYYIQDYTEYFGYPAGYNHNYYYEYDLSNTYDPDSGAPYELSNMPSSQAYDNYGAKTIYVTDLVPTLTGYTFMGWSEIPGEYDYIDESYYAQSSYTLEPNHSRVLYALWKPDRMDYVSAKPLIYDANVPSELLTTTAEDSPVYYYHFGEYDYPYYPTPTGSYYHYESDDKPFDWALVYRVEYDTAFVPVYQGQNNKYVPLSGVAYDIATYPYGFSYSDHSYDVYVLPADVTLANMPLPNSTNIKEDMAYETEIAVTDQVPTLTGYTFLGWSEDYGDSNTVNAKSSYKIAPNSGIVLYAVWGTATPETTSTLKYDDNVADEAITVPADQTLTDGNDPKTFTVSTQKPERDGYVFMGWSNSAGDNSVDVGETIDVAAGETKTIYAVWQAKQAITIKAKSRSWPYDGEDHSLDEWEMTAGSLLTGDTLTVVISGSVHDVADTAEGNNVVESVTVKRGEADVSEYYTITTVNGTLTIEPKPLTVYTPSAEKYYDGKPFESGPNAPLHATIDGLVYGETVDLFMPGERYTQVGEYPNAVEITFADGTVFYEGSFVLSTKLAMTAATRAASVSGVRSAPTAKLSNYVVVSASIGMLRILPFGVPETPSITIKAASAEKTYDGKPLTNAEFTVVGLPTGYTVEVVIESSQTVVGTTDNVIKSYVVKDKLGIDKTSDFNVTTEKGTLKVNPAPLTITADSASKLYDGTPLTKDSYTGTGLADGDEFASVTVTGSQTEVGSSDNVPSDAKIVNAGGEDVTACYDIKYVNGTLTVTDSFESIDDPDTPLHGDEEETIDIEPDEDFYTGNIPLTGDESNIAFWAVIAALAVAGIVTMLAGRKRARSSR